MAFHCVSSSSQYFTIAAPNISVPPVTLSVWIKVSSVVDKNSALFIWRDTIQTGLLLRYFAPNWELRYFVANGTQWQTATGLHVTAGVWQHACLAVTSSQARLYLGDSSFTNNVSHSTANLNVAGNLARDPAPGLVSFDGSIAEPAIWNVALSDGECRALSRGASPLCLKNRLANLVMHKDLVREFNRGHGPALTAVGGPTVTSHPPLVYPHHRLRSTFPRASFLSPFRAAIAAAHASCVVQSCAATVGAAAGATSPIGEVKS